MAGIYRQLLEHIAADPQTALRQRMSLPGREKAMIACAALAGIVRPARGRLGPGRATPGQPAPDGSSPSAATARGSS